jgi:four helix bundle protein
MHKLNELKIWYKAIDLATEVYKATAHFPKEETYGLTSQIRRSAVSVPSNIAEGAGRNTNNDFKHFLAMANGSSYELQTQVIIAQKLELMNIEVADSLLSCLDDLQKMNYRLQQSLLNVK